MTFFAIIFVLTFIFSSLLIALLIIGYHEQVRKATEAANRNAGYWAEAESNLQDARITIATLDAYRKEKEKHCAELSRIAHQALQIAHQREFSPAAEDFDSADSILKGRHGWLPDDTEIDGEEIN